MLNKNICFEEVVERSASTIMARSGGKWLNSSSKGTSGLEGGAAPKGYA